MIFQVNFQSFNAIYIVTALTCDNNMVPIAQGSPCLVTCENPRANDTCKSFDDELCGCPNSQILFQGHCAPCCGCIDSNGVAHEVGLHSTFICDYSTSLCETRHEFSSKLFITRSRRSSHDTYTLRMKMTI